MAGINIQNIKQNEFNNITPFFRNYKTRNINDIDTVVLHWTAGSTVDGAVRTLLKKGYGYHFLISKDAEVFQGSELRSRIGHAGNSYGPNGASTNSTSIGISFAVPGKDKKVTPNDEVSSEMIDVCIRLILDVKRALPKLKWITGHHWVSPGRKVDPWYLNFENLVADLNAEYDRQQNAQSSTQNIINNITNPFSNIPTGTSQLPLSQQKEFQIWKAGYPPFPSGLSNCRCIEFVRGSTTKCKKATQGGCIGPGGESYSPQRVTSKVDDIVLTVRDLDDNLLGT
jgi:N-acetyl-anhydromuramyl-L-alanine amidase AmpD